METDTENRLAERFREIRQEWDLRPGEAETQAQDKGLVPLHAWLSTGVDAPEVVIRAAQVLMADPERPGIHKRPAVKYVFKQISQFWKSAGFKEQDVLILRGMLLAAWMDELSGGNFALKPLLDSAWTATESRLSGEKYLERWRHQQAAPSQAVASTASQHTGPGTSRVNWDPQDITAPDISETIGIIQKSNEDYTNDLAENSAELFIKHNDVLTQITTHINETTQFITQLNSDVPDVSRAVSQTELLWWGQARYSSTKRQPYRRISDATERLWWMAWEGSKLAMGLEVEPSASFLVENLYQLDKQSANQQRPLKDWLADLIGTLRRIHEEEQLDKAISVSGPLEKLAKEDPLGLPVTWARLQAAKPRSNTGAIEERLREDVAVDPDTLIDLGDWAAWIFRESLLDRHLGAR